MSLAKRFEMRRMTAIMIGHALGMLCVDEHEALGLMNEGHMDCVNIEESGLYEALMNEYLPHEGEAGPNYGHYVAMHEQMYMTAREEMVRRGHWQRLYGPKHLEEPSEAKPPNDSNHVTNFVTIQTDDDVLARLIIREVEDVGGCLCAVKGQAKGQYTFSYLRKHRHRMTVLLKGYGIDALYGGMHGHSTRDLLD